MNLFRKLFKRNQIVNDDNGIDVDTLLASSNINNSIIELDNYICKLASWGDTIEKLTDPQKNFFFNQNLEREVNNGGFNQFFINSSGKFSQETITSLLTIGANKTAIIVQQAITQFPNSKVPKNRGERQEIVRQIEETANPFWEELDQKFFIYEDNLNQLNINYVKQNKEWF